MFGAASMPLHRRAAWWAMVGNGGQRWATVAGDGVGGSAYMQINKHFSPRHDAGVIHPPPPCAAPPMATQQHDGGVPFGIAHSAQKLQLLELPPDVVALLDAPNPPRCAPSSRPAAAWSPF